MKKVSIVLLSLLALAASDKPASGKTSPNNIIASISEVSPSEGSSSSKKAQSKSDSYGAPSSSGSTYSSPATGQSTPGDIGTQGYYYYYYPVVNNGGGGSHSSGGVPYEAEAPKEDGLGALFAGKGLLVALVIGIVIILAIAGTGLNISRNGRSLTDLTNYAYENIDDLTGLVLNAVELYQSVNQ